MNLVTFPFLFRFFHSLQTLPRVRPWILHFLLLIFCQQSQAGVVLLYHHVDTRTPAITSISPEMFARHLQIIEEEGFTVRQLGELVADSLAGKNAGAKEVAITFDDAYASIYETAFPMLKERNWPFTIFVATDYVTDNSSYYLSWDQIKEMAASGATIENHTLSHTHLLRQQEGETEDDWRERIRKEIVGANEVLKKEGFEPTAFAFTYGEYDLAMLELLKELELIGFGQQSGAIGPASNPQLLPRFPLAGIYVGEAAFRDKLRSLAMPLEYYDEPTPLVETGYKPALNLTLKATTNPGRMTCYGPGGAMNLTIEESNSVTALPQEEIAVGRSRYNCTLPAGAGRFHWFSQLWIRKRADGSWYPEP